MDASKLRLDDRHMKGVYKAGKLFVNPVYDQVFVVLDTDKKEVFLNHADGTKWNMQPGVFNSVPESVANEMAGHEGIYILSRDEGQAYIEKAKRIALEVNKDIIEFNRKAKEHNAMPASMRDEDWYPIPLKKMLKGEGYTRSPYSLFKEEQSKPKATEKIKEVVMEATKKVTMKKKGKKVV